MQAPLILRTDPQMGDQLSCKHIGAVNRGTVRKTVCEGPA